MITSCLRSKELTSVVQRGLWSRLLRRHPQAPWTMGVSSLSRTSGHSSLILAASLSSAATGTRSPKQSRSSTVPGTKYGAHREGKLQDRGHWPTRPLAMRVLSKSRPNRGGTPCVNQRTKTVQLSSALKAALSANCLNGDRRFPRRTYGYWFGNRKTTRMCDMS